MDAILFLNSWCFAWGPSAINVEHITLTTKTANGALTRWRRANGTPYRASIRRPVKRVGQRKKVRCSRLGRADWTFTRTKIVKKLHSWNFLLCNQQHFGAFFCVLKQWEKASLSELKTGIKLSRSERKWSSRASCKRKRLTSDGIKLMELRKPSSLISS